MSYKPKSLKWINCSLISSLNVSKKEAKSGLIEAKWPSYKSKQMRFKEAKLVSLSTQLEKERTGEIWSYESLERGAFLHGFLSQGCGFLKM